MHTYNEQHALPPTHSPSSYNIYGGCAPAHASAGCSHSGFVNRPDLQAEQTRYNCNLPAMLPYFGRDFVPTNQKPMPGTHGGGLGWAQLTDLESSMRNFENRDTKGQCTDLKGLQLPTGWQMNYLPHGWQQEDDFARHREFTRQDLANVCRPFPCDSMSEYNTRNCDRDRPDCNSRNYPVEAVFQHRLAFP